ncbi:MAG: hypothetical protein HQM08_21725 [Candidatus Riflebacteria bacterium]|nr:hypothetical protein [Candidatus Riflebacteria bacterium]
MKNILLVGAGQLGSRHLQGLAKLTLPISIDIVEPSPQAVEVAQNRFNEIPNPQRTKDLHFFNSLDGLKKSYDLAIFATNSDVRAKLTKDLLKIADVHQILFEKVVFQRIEDFEEVGMLLQKKKIDAYVNFPRRAFPFYSELKGMIQKGEKITYSVSGINWGLACNSLHFFDHLAFFSGETDFELDVSGLDKIIHPSRRQNFIELSGEIRGTQTSGHRIFLYSQNGPSCPFVSHIFTERMNVVLDENLGIARIAAKEKNWVWEEIHYKILYQSELTPLLVSDLFDGRSIPLTKFSEAFDLHRPVLKTFQDFVEKISGKTYGYCPIT